MLPLFQLINMNGRMYDPVIGRVLSPDNYVQDATNAQGFNRYSYALNNPLKYTDPDGEWNWIVAAIGTIFGYVSYGITHNDWGWKAVGNAVITGALWGIGYTSGVEAAGITPVSYAAQSVITSTVNQFMPAINVPIGDNFSINASLGLGVGPNGIIAGMNFSGTYYNGDFSLTGGIGVSDNMSSWGGGFNIDGYGASYYRTTYGNATGPDGKPNPQVVGGVGLYFGDVSIRLENDFLAGSGDKWRSNALEVGIGNFVFGTYLYNNDPEGGDKGVMKSDDPRAVDRRGNRNLHKKTAWEEGKTYRSPGYIGYRKGSNILRLGYSHEIFQDRTQNWVHRNGFPGLGWLGIGYQNFYNDYSDFQRGGYRYSGYYNPYSLFY
jgi:RHS repeat-associated protein